MTFPNLTATSFLRSSGSHATGEAIDLAIANYSELPGSEYDKLSLYCSVFLDLASRMPVGRIWISSPPNCMHYHIDLTKAKQFGWEEVEPNARGNCEFLGYTNFADLDDAISTFRLWLADPTWLPLELEPIQTISQVVTQYWAEPLQNRLAVDSLIDRAFPPIAPPIVLDEPPVVIDAPPVFPAEPPPPPPPPPPSIPPGQKPTAVQLSVSGSAALLLILLLLYYLFR